jgi:peptidoglycan/LPS O-acetylase OafA/YrhL
LVAWLVARRTNWISWWQIEALMLIPFACVGVVGQVFVHDHTAPYWVANTLGGTSDWFVGGMSLAVISVAAHDGPGVARRLGGMVERWSWLIWLGGVAVFLTATRIFDVRDLTNGRPGVYGVSTATWIANHVGLGLAAALLLAPAVFGARGPVRWLLSWRPLAWLGLISYGIYLWHFPLAVWLGLKGAYPKLHGGGLDIVNRVHTQPTLVLFVATLAVSTVIAAASYYIVELPFLRLKDRGGGRGPGPTSTHEPPRIGTGEANAPSARPSVARQQQL